MRLLIASIALIAASACEPPVRGEVVLTVDTDLAVPDLADTLRVEVFSRSGVLLDERELLLATPDRWPVSLSVAAETLGGAPTFRLRLTAFAASRPPATEAAEDLAAVADAVCPDGVTADPPPTARALPASHLVLPLPQYAVSRLVDIDVPGDERLFARVVLHASCLGQPLPAMDDAATCIDGAPGAPADGVEPDPDDARLVGSAPLLAELPCEGGDAERACIPGGVGYLGEPIIDQLDCPTCRRWPPVPVRVRSFLMDRHEVTVGRYLDAIAHPDPAMRFVPTAPPPTAPDDDAPNCTLSATADRALPLVCVTTLLAEEFCAWAGGQLPSEAQWEHAAFGRGRGFAYPWGDEPPLAGEVALAIGQPAPVDAFPRDTSPEGVVGLLGNVSEILADRPGALSRAGCRPRATRSDAALAYDGGVADDAPCACAGILQEPPFETAAVRLLSRVVRGGNWFEHGDARQRNVLLTSEDPADAARSAAVGFRCVYEVPR